MSLRSDSCFNPSIVARALFCVMVLAAQTSRAQTSISGNSLILKSSGAASGNAWTLSTNGYVGTYLTLAQPGSINISANAAGQSSGGVFPQMTFSIADYDASFSIRSTTPTGYSYTTPTLPAGTYFLRTQLDSQTGSGIPSLTIADLQVSSNATVVNSSTDALALAAANTYINNFRRGSATVRLVGAQPGTTVNVDLTRNAFNFGGTVSGVFNNDSKDMITATPPAAGTEQAKFQSFINANFNTIVPSNAGKWASNESGNTQPASPTMTLVDKQANYAAAHGMQERMHNLLWGTQQPTWVNNLIAQAQAGDATAKANLSNAIANRIQYYVGGANAGNAQRSRKYLEIDVLNEAEHNAPYWNIYSPAGIAEIYKQVGDAAAAAGSNAKLYLNEYNVLQFSPASISWTGAQQGSDAYANWYRNQVAAVNNAALSAYGERVVTGIGFQLYANLTATGSNALSTATMQKALQNLSIEGLPLSMTEFGLGSSTTIVNSQTLGPAALENTMRMIYGTPLATTFMIWGWWDLPGANYPPAALLDNTQGNNALTPMGERWQSLMSTFSTHLAPTIDASGRIDFNGFYGSYDLTLGGRTYDLELIKGKPLYTLLINPTRGDFDLDGKLSDSDIQPMFEAIANPALYQDVNGLTAADLITLGDFNSDRELNDADFAIMVASVDEPPGVALALCGLAVSIPLLSSKLAHNVRGLHVQL